jgi:hypothetical protein
MPSGFAIPAAVGDYVAAILALIVIVALHSRSRWGIPAAWAFNIVGVVDLLDAFVQAGPGACILVGHASWTNSISNRKQVDGGSKDS